MVAAANVAQALPAKMYNRQWPGSRRVQFWFRRIAMERISALSKVVALTLLVAVAPSRSFAQGVEPKALTEEEIRKELAGAVKFTGEISFNGKRLCSLDTGKTESYPWRSLNKYEDLPKTWVTTGPNPTFTIKLSIGAPGRLFLASLGGESDKEPIVLQKDSSAKTPTYSLRFSKGLESGNYEFAETEGTLAFFFRCGFTVQK
jgi:hypothetical protein